LQSRSSSAVINSILAPQLRHGVPTHHGNCGPSGTGKRCNNPILPPPIWEAHDIATNSTNTSTQQQRLRGNSGGASSGAANASASTAAAVVAGGSKASHTIADRVGARQQHQLTAAQVCSHTFITCTYVSNYCDCATVDTVSAYTCHRCVSILVYAMPACSCKFPVCVYLVSGSMFAQRAQAGQQRGGVNAVRAQVLQLTLAC
jgi:hypothetical protein